MNWINFLINLLILFNLIKFIRLNQINGEQINNKSNKTDNELKTNQTFNQLNEQIEDKSKFVYKLDNQLDNQLNSQIKVNCDQNYSTNCSINRTKLINIEDDQNRIENKNFKNQSTSLQKSIKPNSTTINRSLNDNFTILPHSRPESELFELNRTTIFDNKNRSFINELENRNQQQIYQPFTPITITWNKINQFNRQTTKCIPKEIPNSTFKLRYNGRSVRYYCNENYKAKGTTRLYCIQGRWTNEFPICKPTNGTNDQT